MQSTAGSASARRLRALGFAVELPAVGDVLLDQLSLMLRAGFDAFEIVNAPTIAVLVRGQLPAVQRSYQAGIAGKAHPWLSRRALDEARS